MLNPQASCFPPIAYNSAPPLAVLLGFIILPSLCVELTQAVTVGVAVVVRSLLNTKERENRPVSTSHSCQLPPVFRPGEKRQVIHYSSTGVCGLRQLPARANMQEEVGQLSSTVALLCSWGKGMSSGSH